MDLSLTPRPLAVWESFIDNEWSSLNGQTLVEHAEECARELEEEQGG